MASASVTRRELSLGAQDTVTGLYAKSFAEMTIQGSVQPRGAVMLGLPCGHVARYPHTLFTADVIAVGDEVKDANGDYYVVKSADQYWWLDQFSHYQCELEKRSPYALRPTTSGTWHLDSDSLRTDPRYRHKYWLDSYLTADNMELDDGSTNASVITCFSGADYPLTQVFLTKAVDGVFSIDKRSAQQLTTYNHYPYAFLETVPITCYAIDKAGLTATNLLEQMEQEIRHVCTDHPLGSIRSIESTDPTFTDIGGVKLWHTTITIRYKRANDDYTPTYPTITWGPSAAPTGTYVMQNVIRGPEDGLSKDAWIDIPSFSGTLSQTLGSKSLEIEFEMDLDVECSAKTFKRPQTTTPKTDADDWDIFRDIWHNGGINQTYQTLTLKSGGPSIKVRLLDYRTHDIGEGRRLTVRFREYRTTTASAQTYKQRLGIS